MYTKQQLINIGIEKLADIILSLCQNRPDIQEQLDNIFADFVSEPKEISMIKEEISSLYGCKCYIDYNEVDSLAYEINQIRTNIMENILPKSPNHAIELLLSLLDSHENTIGRADDSDGEVGEAFKQACADLCFAYKQISNSVEDLVKVVCERHMNNNFGVYDDIISHFEDLLGEEGLNQLGKKIAESSNHKDNFKTMAAKIGLESIEDCQNNVDAYIKACYISGELSTHDHLEIAKRLIKHGRGKEAISLLDFIELRTHGSKEDNMDLKVQALDLCGDFKEAQAIRQEWFCMNLSTKVYHEIVKNCEAGFIESWKNTAVQKAFEFENSLVALKFLNEIKEYEQAAKLVYQKIDTLDGKNCYALRPMADILCKVDPLAATLLYRKMVKDCLVTKHYDKAGEDLAVCHSLSSKVTEWQGYKNHQLYFKELSVQHKRKKRFWSDYNSALHKYVITQDAQVASVKRKLSNR